MTSVSPEVTANSVRVDSFLEQYYSMNPRITAQNTSGDSTFLNWEMVRKNLFFQILVIRKGIYGKVGQIDTSPASNRTATPAQNGTSHYYI